MSSNLEKPGVLVIDDVEANLVAIEALLAGMDCDVVLAEEGNEALRQLLKRRFAVMLLDVQMPGMDGYEVAALARENPETRDVPIVFLTANHASEEGMLRGYGTGAVDYLFKPINAHVLRAKVRVFLELHLQRQRLAEEVAAHEATLESLREANTALRHFTHAASHDLRAPLRTMTGYLGIVREDFGPSLGAEPRQHLERVAVAASRMEALLASLLTYAKLESARAFTEVNCVTIAEQAVADLASTLSVSEARVEIGSLPSVRGDAARLYQLFLNLIANANKFRRTDVVPRVILSAERKGAEWLFCAEDNGIGIDAAHRERIFEPFRRLHSTRDYEGSGLGLVICRQIVEQHGGRIWVESEPGRGSRFWFALPSDR